MDEDVPNDQSTVSSFVSSCGMHHPFAVLQTRYIRSAGIFENGELCFGLWKRYDRVIEKKIFQNEIFE